MLIGFQPGRQFLGSAQYFLLAAGDQEHVRTALNAEPCGKQVLRGHGGVIGASDLEVFFELDGGQKH